MIFVRGFGGRQKYYIGGSTGSELDHELVVAGRG
jgi:hypothetical protein